jgi:hypothetical protein
MMVNGWRNLWQLYNQQAYIAVKEDATPQPPAARKELAHGLARSLRWGMEQYLLLDQAGGKMKETETIGRVPNEDATNSSGFRGGCDGNGAFDSIGSNGNWWSSTDEHFIRLVPRPVFTTAPVSRPTPISLSVSALPQGLILCHFDSLAL